MKTLVENIAKHLVDHPEAVEVTQVLKEDEYFLQLQVAPDDMGKVIGKQGKIAKAIRAVVKAAATKDHKKATLEIK